MEFNKNVSNPMLIGAIELMKAEDTQAHRGMFVEELVKAEFLSPAIVEPAPEEGPDGGQVLAQGSKGQLPMLSTSAGTAYCSALPMMKLVRLPETAVSRFAAALS